MENINKERQYFDSLQELRGLSAIFIVLSHIPLTKHIYLSLGSYGVAIFFLLSSFLTVHTTENRYDKFLLKRAIRIIPLYYIITLFTFIVALYKPNWFNTITATFPNLIKSLLFIPYKNDNGSVRPILDVGWSLVAEVWFYIIFFVAMKISHKYRAEITLAILLILYAYIYIYSIKPNMSNSVFNQYKLSVLSLATGVFIYIVWKKYLCQLSFNVDNLTLKRSCTCIIYCIYVIFGMLYNLFIANGYNVLALIFPITIFTVFLTTNNIIIRFKPILFVGTISYSLYLSHEFIVKGVSRLIFELEEVRIDTIAVSVLCVFVAVAIATFIYNFLEKKIGGMLTSLIKR